MPHKNAPRIVKLYGGQQDQYFIIVEQDILVGTSSISSAVLLWFAAHYAFDMEYGYTDVGNFFQDFIYTLKIIHLHYYTSEMTLVITYNKRNLFQRTET